MAEPSLSPKVSKYLPHLVAYADSLERRAFLVPYQKALLYTFLVGGVSTLVFWGVRTGTVFAMQWSRVQLPEFPVNVGLIENLLFGLKFFLLFLTVLFLFVGYLKGMKDQKRLILKREHLLLELALFDALYPNDLAQSSRADEATMPAFPISKSQYKNF